MGDLINKPVILDRIKQVYNLAGNSELSRFLGVAPNTITNWYNRNSIDYDTIFTKCENVNLEWLITGKGEPNRERTTNSKNSQSIISQTKIERKLIPFFDAIAEAGTLSVANMDSTYPAEMVDAGDFFQDATAIMQVHGDSMYPTYKSGSLVALKEVYNKRLIMFGEDYVIETSEYRVIKRIQKSDDKTCWLACSTNTEIWEQGSLKGKLIHEPFEVPIDEVRHVYLVLGEIHRKHNNRIIHNV